ncbi:MAG: hypothetical protein HEQ39_10950 [Rhizobacter sp.]
MAQENPGAVGAVQSVSSTSKVGNVGEDSTGLPSQKSVDIATDLAAEFKQPDEKIPAISEAVEGLLNGKTQGERVDSFKKLADLLGIDLGKKEEAGAAEAGGAGAAGGAGEAGAAEDSLESLIEKLIKMLKAKGMSDEQIKALLGPDPGSTGQVAGRSHRHARQGTRWRQKRGRRLNRRCSRCPNRRPIQPRLNHLRVRPNPHSAQPFGTGADKHLAVRDMATKKAVTAAR